MIFIWRWWHPLKQLFIEKTLTRHPHLILWNFKKKPLPYPCLVGIHRGLWCGFFSFWVALFAHRFRLHYRRGDDRCLDRVTLDACAKNSPLEKWFHSPFYNISNRPAFQTDRPWSGFYYMMHTWNSWCETLGLWRASRVHLLWFLGGTLSIVWQRTS